MKLEISLVRAVYGIEREFDRYYMRLKQSLKGNTSYLLATMSGDPTLIQYVVKRSMERNEEWAREEHEFEQIETTHNDLVCYISKSQNRRTSIDCKAMLSVLSH